MLDLSIFDNIKGAANPTVNVEDVRSSPAYQLSPAEQRMFNEQQNAYPDSTGALNNISYYPNANSPINVGNYSGSVIGSTSLFAPEGALVPIGMMDARDAALQKAALQKAKEVQDFQAKLKSKVPKSKLTGINEELTNRYIGTIEKEWNKALQENDGDPNKATFALKNNFDFQKKLEAFENFKLTGDATSEKLAKIQDRIAKKEVVSPELKYYMEKVQESMNPESPEFKNLTENIFKMDAEQELGSTISNLAKDIKRQKDAEAGINVNSEEYRISESTDTYFRPEHKQFLEEAVLNIYPGSTLYSPEKIKKAVNDYTSAHERTKKVSVNEKNDSGGAGKQVDYSSAQPLTETEQNIKSPSGTLESKYAQTAYKTLGKDEKMVLRIPISKSMREANKVKDDKSLGGKGGYIQGTVSQIQNMPYDINRSEYLSVDEVKRLKESGNYYGNKNIRLKPRGVINLDRPEGEKGNIESQNTVYVDVDEIKGKFTNKLKQKGQSDFDDKINELKEEANQFNSESEKKNQSKQTETKIKSGDVIDGYRYMGGDTKDPKNWKKI